MIKKVAIILSGCGVYDGAEIQESVFALFALAKRGIGYQCFAPDIEQFHVVNHISGEAMSEARNVLVESARITRGNTLPLSDLNADDYDALLLPGGFGVAKNLSNFAFSGTDMSVEKSVLKACQQFATSGKPAGYACIAPALIPHVYGKGVVLTIGNDTDTAAALEAMGAQHTVCAVNGVVTDQKHKVVTTPAYMLAEDIVQVAESLDNLVAALLSL